MVVRELLAKLGFQISDTELKHWNNLVEKAKKNMGDFVQSAQRASVDIAKYAAAGATAATAALTGLTVLVAKTAGEVESLKASLKTVTGSQAAGEQAFAGIKKFARETPFTVREITQAFIKLKALGLDPSEAALRSYGNTASAFGTDLKQWVEAVADATNLEFERLREYGIIASKSGDKVSLTFQGVTTTVGANAKEIERYLRRIGDVNFAGAMTGQMDTFRGVMSNLQDAWDSFLVTVGENGVLSALKAVATEMGAMMGTSGDLGKVVGQALGTAIIGLWSGLQKLLPVLADNVHLLPEFLELLTDLVKVGATVIEWVVSFTDALGGIENAIMLALPALAALKVAALGIGGPAGAIAVAAASLIAAIPAFMKFGEEAVEPLIERITGLRRELDELDRRNGGRTGKRGVRENLGKNGGAGDAAILGDPSVSIAELRELSGGKTQEQLNAEANLSWEQSGGKAGMERRRIQRAALDELERRKAGEAQDLYDIFQRADDGASIARGMNEQYAFRRSEMRKEYAALRKKRALTPSEKKRMQAIRKELDIAEGPKGRGGRKKHTDLSGIEAAGIADFIRNRGAGEGLDPLLAGVVDGGGASEEAIKTALEAAAKAFNKGASPDVAKKAGIDALRKLTGEAKGSSRGLNDILEDFGAGRTRGGKAVGGVMPTLGTTINKITNEFKPTITQQFSVSGTQGESSEVFARRVAEIARREYDAVVRVQFDRFKGGQVA